MFPFLLFDYPNNDLNNHVVPFFFQETPQAEDEAGVTEEELWSKVIRSVVTRFNELDDAIKPECTSKASEYEAEYQQQIRKYAEDKENYDVYQTLMHRDKELYQIRLDIFELKRMFLEHYGRPELIGPRPTYIKPPKVNLQMPTPLPKYQPPPKSPLKQTPPPSTSSFFPTPSAPPATTPMGSVASPPDHFGRRKDRNNEIFRSIMNSKSQEGLNVLGEEGIKKEPDFEDESEIDLSGSWENIPPTEFSGETEY